MLTNRIITVQEVVREDFGRIFKAKSADYLQNACALAAHGFEVADFGKCCESSQNPQNIVHVGDNGEDSGRIFRNRSILSKKPGL